MTFFSKILTIPIDNSIIKRLFIIKVYSWKMKVVSPFWQAAKQCKGGKL